MKFHLVNINAPKNKHGEPQSACGVFMTPEKFGFDQNGFVSHHNQQYACKKCLLSLANNLTK